MKTIVIGGIAAGMSTASKLKRLAPNEHIIVVERGEETSYGACGLPYYISGVNPVEDLLRIRKADVFRQAGIDLRLRCEVTGVDAENRRVTVKNLVTDDEVTESYDCLVAASGADSIMPSFENRDLGGIFTLKTIADANRIKQELTEEVKNIAVIGGGNIGLEMVESFLELGRNVALFEQAPRLLPGFDSEISGSLFDFLVGKGVKIHLGKAVTGFEGKGRLQAVRSGAGHIPADLALVAVGVRPNTGFLVGSGIKMLPNGAILVNEYMESSIPGIYAAGDCASVFHRILKKQMYMPLATNANKQGRYIAENIMGNRRRYITALGTFMIKVCEMELAKTGISEGEAQTHSIPCLSICIDGPNRAPYYPGGTMIKIKLVFCPGSGKLLGAQLMGGQGAALRINTLAACITAGMTVEEIGELDFGYAPPYAMPWDVIHVAANMAQAKFEKNKSG